jgi:hypothetical protein
MGRFTDAWQTLIGRSDPQIRAHAKLVRIEAEWYSICRSIEHVLQDLNLADDKLRKREERAAKRATAATPAAPAATPAALPLSPKDALRARLRAEGKLGVPPGRAGGGNGQTDEPQANQ